MWSSSSPSSFWWQDYDANAWSSSTNQTCPLCNVVFVVLVFPFLEGTKQYEIGNKILIHYSSLFSTLLAIFYLSAELLTICGSGCLEIQKSKIGFKKGTWRSSDKSKRPAKSCGKRPSGAGCECVPVFSGSLSSVPLLAAFDVLPHLQVHLVRLPVCGKRSMKSIFYF